MRVIILGVSGLIGHKLLQKLSSDFEIFGVLHHSKDYYNNPPLFSGQNIIENINVSEFDILKGVLYTVNPDIIINCVGITKRKIDINDPLDAISINSAFPHQLAKWAKVNKKRVIHFSTDCVFNGKIGNYTETSLSSAEDVYGKTKYLGELHYDNTITIRSSFIGQELFDKTELFEWFLAQSGKQIKGFKNTLYSGVSTIFMASVVKDIILNYPGLSGLYQLATEKPISKYQLLNLAKKVFDVKVDIIPDIEHIHCPTLDASKLRKAINIAVPSWEEMMTDLLADKKFYSNL
jgi:dTDP-4-dehydrorhamnose reductase